MSTDAFPAAEARVNEGAVPVIERAYALSGMTCGHCAESISEEVGDVAGVIAVDVDLTADRMVVRSHGVSDYAVLQAVTEAGYAATRS